MNYLFSIGNLVAGFLLLCAAVDATGPYRRNPAAALFWALLGCLVIVNGLYLWP